MMFRERITRNYQSLSPSFKKVADFILTDHQRAAFMSASRMARYVGVDVATVTRFAQYNGYEGFVEMIREIQETVLQEMREARAPITERFEAAENPFMLTLWRDWANLEKTIQNIQPEEAQKAVDAIRAARNVYLVGEGVGAGLAQATASYLSASKPYVFALTGGPFDTAMTLKHATSEDVVIGIGFTNYAYSAARALAAANKVGATTIGVIGQADCPIGQVANILLACSATEEGFTPSSTSVMAILFSLAYSCLQSDSEGYHRDLVQFQETYADLTEGTARGEESVVEDLIGRF